MILILKIELLPKYLYTGRLSSSFQWNKYSLEIATAILSFWIYKSGFLNILQTNGNTII